MIIKIKTNLVLFRNR